MKQDKSQFEKEVPTNQRDDSKTAPPSRRKEWLRPTLSELGSVEAWTGALSRAWDPMDPFKNGPLPS